MRGGSLNFLFILSKIEASLVRALPRYHRGQGSNPRLPEFFFRLSFRNCVSCVYNPVTAKCGQRQISTKVPNFIFLNFETQSASCENTGRELLSEWSHHRISSIDSKVRVTLHSPLKHSGSEGVNSGHLLYIYSINPLSGVYLDLFFQWLYIIFQTVTRLFFVNCQPSS